MVFQGLPRQALSIYAVHSLPPPDVIVLVLSIQFIVVGVRCYGYRIVVI